MLKQQKRFNFERLVAGFGVAVCCVLLIQSVPRFVASLYTLYPATVIKQTEDKLPKQAYEKCTSDLKTALDWYAHPEYWQSQAICNLSLLRAFPLQSGAEKKALLEQTQISIMQSLKLSPVDPYLWFRLAAVDRLLELPSSKIVNVLRLSFYSGRVEPKEMQYSGNSVC